MLAALDVEAAVELDGRRWNVGGYNNSCPTWNHCPAQLCPGLYGTCAYLNRSQPSISHPTGVSHTQCTPLIYPN